MFFLRIIFTILLQATICQCVFAQEKIQISGTVTDENKNPIGFVSIVKKGTTYGATTDEKGRFIFDFIVENDEEEIEIDFFHISYQPFIYFVKDTEKKKITLQVTLQKQTVEMIEAEFKGERDKMKASEQTLDIKELTYFPTASSGIEGLLKTLPGVMSNNELSSQYSVRGGNFDENLVYVNDFEIYRPFIIRSGQQEGLSFINPDLVQKVKFSAGGFEAKYGDKMSSVLSIQYKRPEEFRGSVTASLLGVNTHLEGASKNKKLSFLTGFRYRSNAYLLGSLDTRGIYNPRYLDFQTWISYKINDKLEIEGIFNHASNNYQFVPEERVTTTGTINQVLRFSVFFEGNQRDYFNNTMGGLSINHQPNDKLGMKWMASLFSMSESENFNIIGQYRLDEIETDFSSEDFGEVKATLGVGQFHNWGRNQLDALVYNFAHRGKSILGEKHLLQWGTTVQNEIIDDRLSEWQKIDSAGYSLPYNGSEIGIYRRIKSSANLNSWRIHGYVQDEWDLSSDSVMIILTGGIRYNYWSLNKEFFVNPRFQLSIKPNTKKDVVFRMATGMYWQPPFYRELRDSLAQVSTTVKAQRSVHAVLGTDLYFKIKQSNFKFTSELYYKHLDRLNPYEIDDVRIRYYGDNLAKGYAAGVDVRLSGEFVRKTESWVSLSFMHTQEDLYDDFYFDSEGNRIEPGYIPRPTDQRFSLGIFFSDYIPKSERFKVHLNFLFGSRLPFGPPQFNRYNDILRIPPYRRVDIGFSAILLDNEEKALKNPKSVFRHFDKIWLSAEIFNLLGISNTLSYVWVKDVRNLNWPLPNFLTDRRFNVKLHVSF